MESSGIPQKKRNRTENEDVDDMLVEIDENELGSAKEKEVINVEFIFSCIKEEYFSMIKSLIRPIFQFEKVSLTGLSDLIIQMRENVGTTIIPDDDEDKIVGVFTVIPFRYFKENPSVMQIVSMINEKIEGAEGLTSNAKLKAKNILKKKAIGMIINERIINIPEELIPPAMKFISKEINECVSADDYDGRFKLEYMIIITRVAKRRESKGKKRKQIIENTNNLYYKYETEIFLTKAEISFEYKIPYFEHDMEMLENETQPQFINILFIRAEEYFEIVELM